MSPNLTRLRVWRALVYGLLATLGLIGLVTLVWAAVPSGSSVLYTGTDTVTMPVGTMFNAQILGALGPFTASGSIAFSGELTPLQITSNQNDYNPSGLATKNFLRLSTDASRDLTGLATGALGRIITIHNVGAQNLAIRAESLSSAPANRFAMPSDLILPANGMIVIQYDSTAPSPRWRTIAPQLTGGTLNGALLTLQQQAGDGSPAPAGTVVVYAKTDGNVFARDPAGNVKELVNAGGTGPGSGVGLTARLITLTNMDLLGEETIEGITTTPGTRVFVAGQTDQTKNGIYLTGASWARAADALTGSTFATGTLVTISDGIAGATGNKGTTWMYTSAGTYNTSALTSVKTAYGPSTAAFEQIVNKGVVSGYPSLGPDSMLTWTQLGSRATHAPVAAASTITPTATTMGVEGSGGPVTMGSGDPRISGCTLTAHHGRKLTVKGSHATNTLTMPNGQGVRLCGNTGSVVFGLNQQAADFVCDGNVPEWQQIGCGDLQQAKNVNGTMLGATDLASAVKICDTANGNCLNLYGSTIQGTQGGAGINHVVNIPAGKSLIIQGNGIEYEQTTSAGAHSYSSSGKPRAAVEFDAGAITPDGANCTAPTEQVLNGALSPKTWAFSCLDSNSSIFYGKISMKRSGWDGGPVRFLLTVFHATTETITFAGDFSAMCRSAGDLVDATWGTAVAADVAITTANRLALQETTDVTPNGPCAPGDMIFWRYVVDAATFSTNAANTKVLTVTMSYLKGTRNADNE